MLAGCSHIVREFMLSALARTRTRVQVLGQYTHTLRQALLIFKPNLRGRQQFHAPLASDSVTITITRSSQSRSHSSIHKAYYANASRKT